MHRAKHAAMTEHQTSRTLVKSAPELWAECSDAASLARHLGAFGEIRIIKLEPETAVAWEGAAARGTVRLEPSGWGTRVTLTVTAPEPEVSRGEPEVTPPAEVPDVHQAPQDPGEDLEPAAVVAVVAQAAAQVDSETAAGDSPARLGMLARLMLRLRRRPVQEPELGGGPELGQEREPAAGPELWEEPVLTSDPEPALRPDDTDAHDRHRREPVPATAAPAPRGAEPAEAASPPEEELALTAALDSLGRAHHRPYSRA